MIENFPKEFIPDESNLFYRVHKQYIIDGEIIPGAFQSKGDGMSTDWDRYATPERALSLSKEPADNGIIKLSVLKIRKESSMVVEHDPIVDNRAHSLVLGIPEKGEFKTKVRSILKRISEWEIIYKSN